MFNIPHLRELPDCVKIAIAIWVAIVLMFAVANCDATRPIIEHNADLIEEEFSPEPRQPRSDTSINGS